MTTDPEQSTSDVQLYYSVTVSERQLEVRYFNCAFSGAVDIVLGHNRASIAVLVLWHITIFLCQDAISIIRVIYQYKLENQLLFQHSHFMPMPLGNSKP